MSSLRLLTFSMILGITLPCAAFEPMRASTGQVLIWPGDAAFVVCADAPERAAIWAGALTWWTYGGVLREVQIEDEPPSCQLEADGVIAITRFDEPGSWPSAFGLESNTVAFTVHTFESSTGVLQDSDVALNTATFAMAREPGAQSFDLRFVVAHEMGHSLGLDHPCGHPEGQYPSCFNIEREVLVAMEPAVMFGNRSAGPRPLSLTEDDAEGIEAVLGPAEPRPIPELCLSDEGLQVLSDDMPEIEVLGGDASAFLLRYAGGGAQLIEAVELLPCPGQPIPPKDCTCVLSPTHRELPGFPLELACVVLWWWRRSSHR